MEIDYKIIKRYLEDKWTTDDEKKIKGWFNNLRTEQELRARSLQYWDEMEDNCDTSNYDESVILGRIFREIKVNEFGSKQKSNSVRRIFTVFSKIAAILFIPIIILFTIQYSGRISRESEITYNEIYAPPGSRTMFTLPDGSKGWLNGDSYLRYPQSFKRKSRTVSLRGEAFFNVVTNPDRPFIVTSKNLDIVAKGTAFNVNSWGQNAGVRVTLVHGKLEIYQKKSSKLSLIATLKPSQLLNYSRDESASYIKDVDVNKYVCWTEGKLIFRDDPFSEVVKRISQWYNVNIIIKDERLKTYTYVATFQDESLDEVLKMLKISAPINYKNIERKQEKDGTFEKRTVELYYNPKSK